MANHDAEMAHTPSERVEPCQTGAEPQSGASATTVDPTSTGSASASLTSATGGTESSTTAVSGPSGQETLDPSRAVTGASTRAISRGFTSGPSAEKDALSKVKAAVAEAQEMDRLGIDQFKTGQSHLPPAFREVVWKDAFFALTRIITKIEKAVADIDPGIPPVTTGGADDA